jgi:hypothetical protein
MDAFWSALKEGKPAAAPQVVRRTPGQRLAAAPEFDVAVAGGTLGILLATALQVGCVCGLSSIARRVQQMCGPDELWNRQCTPVCSMKRGLCWPRVPPLLAAQAQAGNPFLPCSCGATAWR